MTTPELLDFVKQQLAVGTPREIIQSQLLTQGWTIQDITEAFAIVTKPVIPAPSVIPVTSAMPTAPAGSAVAATPAKAMTYVPTVETPPPTAVQHTPLTAVHSVVDPASAPVTHAPMTTTPPVSIPSVAEESLVPASAPGVKKPASHWKRYIITVIVVLLILGVAGGAAYAYEQKIGPFARVPYTEDDLLAGLAHAFSTIDTSSYQLSGSLAVGPRDADAVPFAVPKPNNAQLAVQYARDVQRARDVSALLFALAYSSHGSYPANIQGVGALASRPGIASTTDPLSHESYEYTLAPGKKDFQLVVTFETPDALAAVQKQYASEGTSTIISSLTKTVVFTKKSSSFFSLPSSLPQPLLQQLADELRFVPVGTNASVSVAATSDWKDKNADVSSTVDATADLGDFSFKFNMDVLKKGPIVYLRINNIPGLFGNELTSLKGEWIKVDPAASSTWPIGFGTSFATKLPAAQIESAQTQAQATDFVRRLIQTADKEHLFTFTDPPHSEQVDGRLLYRYDLQVSQGSLVSFFTAAADLARSYPTLPGAEAFNDPGTLRYLQSDEFNQMFDYYTKNTKLVLYVDPQGLPAIVEYTVRVVPPDTATALKGKQINLTLKLSLSNINQPVNIVAPENAVPVGDVLKHMMSNMSQPSLP